jgi:hypothetical protein
VSYETYAEKGSPDVTGFDGACTSFHADIALIKNPRTSTKHKLLIKINKKISV